MLVGFDDLICVICCWVGLCCSYYVLRTVVMWYCFINYVFENPINIGAPKQTPRSLNHVGFGYLLVPGRGAPERVFVVVCVLLLMIVLFWCVCV